MSVVDLYYNISHWDIYNTGVSSFQGYYHIGTFIIQGCPYFRGLD